MEYPKIQSLWKRVGRLADGTFDRTLKKHPLIHGDWSTEEFAAIKHWSVDEKVDGTNIRIFYQDGKVSFGGRTSNAQIPCHLLKYLQDTFTTDLLHKAFPCSENEPYPRVILFGEGYGPKIQACGGNYRKDAGFILFDIWVSGWWLQKQDVVAIAEKLGIPTTPHLGMMTVDKVVEYVKSKPLSKCSETEQVMEGVICRSHPLMLFRNGKPIMFKLKVKDIECSPE